MYSTDHSSGMTSLLVIVKKIYLPIVKKPGVVFIEFLKNGGNDCLTHKPGAIAYFIFFAEGIEGIHFPPVKHDCLPVISNKLFFYFFPSYQTILTWWFTY